MSRNLWDIRLTLDELQDRTSYDRNLQDVAFDLTDQIDILREVLRNRWDTLVFDAELTLLFRYSLSSRKVLVGW